MRYNLFKYFNPRSREGSDQPLPCFSGKYVYFNPRSREGSDGTFQHPESHYIKFQSTLPRRERPLATSPVGIAGIISIHAPAKGATVCPRTSPCAVSISIHAPAKGATLNRYTHILRFTYFNPRSREGSDVTAVFACPNLLISIHAPAKGATLLENLAESPR